MLIKHGDGKVLSVIKPGSELEEEELDEHGNPLKESTIKKIVDKKSHSVKKEK